MKRHSWIVVLLGGMGVFGNVGRAAKPDARNTTDEIRQRSNDNRQTTKKAGARWRQPVGLWLAPDERVLWVALRRAGQLVAMDLTTGECVRAQRLTAPPEALVGVILPVVAQAEPREPRRVVQHPTTSAVARLFLPNQQQNYVEVLDIAGTSVVGMYKIPTSAPPAVVVARSDGRRVWTSSRWEHLVQARDFAPESSEPRLVFQTKLDFAPHGLTLTPNQEFLLVADAFRGNLGALDARTGQVRRQHLFPGTNIRGLQFSPDGHEFYFTHQIQSQKTMITQDAVFWGAFLTNNLRRVPWDVFLNPHADPVAESRIGFLGDSRRGAGDPGNLLARPDGMLIVCLTGVGEIGVDRQRPYSFDRVAVGQGPVAVVSAKNGRRLYVANAHDDTISVMDVPNQRLERTLALGPTPTFTSVERGEKLFHDARLSLDGWFSCHSCHTNGHTNGNNADTMADNSYGAPKNAPSLFGVGETGPWGWTGRFDSLEAQIHNSVEHTMQGAALTPQQTIDLANYLRALPPLTSVKEKSAGTARGAEIFRTRGCVECHSPPNYTSKQVVDIGLNDGIGGNQRFNPPSLRGVRHSAPYFHDGRATTLREVFTRYHHPLSQPLSPDDLEELLLFLQSL